LRKADDLRFTEAALSGEIKTVEARQPKGKQSGEVMLTRTSENGSKDSTRSNAGSVNDKTVVANGGSDVAEQAQRTMRRATGDMIEQRMKALRADFQDGNRLRLVRQDPKGFPIHHKPRVLFVDRAEKCTRLNLKPNFCPWLNAKVFRDLFSFLFGNAVTNGLIFFRPLTLRWKFRV
jgi:hypothetical protein